jgi:LysR family transcriptional regulator, transcriptional activator of nhaA
MNLQLNYHHLRYFLAVASEGGIKAAADVLHVSPPTLSTQVRELESFLGTPLFVREGRRLLPTDAGRVVQRYAERIFGLGDEMLEVVRRGAPVGPQTVHLGIGDAVPKLLVSSILIRALHEAPDLRVVVREGLPGELYPALVAHQIDLVVANEPPPSSLKTALFSRRAGRFAVSFVAAPSLVKKFRRHSGLDGFPVLVPTRESPLRRELDRWWEDEGIRPDIRAEFDDAAAMCEMAADGAGAAPLPAPVLDSAVRRYGLRTLPLRTGIHEELFVVTAERQFAHEGVRILARVAGAPVGKGGKKRPL